MSELSEIPVVFVVDDNYVPYLSVAIVSLVQKASPSEKYSIYILHKALSEFSKIKLKYIVRDYRNITIEFVNIKTYIEKYESLFYVDGISHIKESCYYRFFIPEIFKNKYVKIIYLDCDLVLLGNLGELQGYNLGDSYVGGVRDYGFILWRKNLENIKKLHIEDPFDYINSGVLLFNIKLFVEQNVFEELIRCIKENKSPLCHDQDIINMACRNRIFYLPFTWNVQCHEVRLLTEEDIKAEFSKNLADDFYNALDCPNIVHYTSCVKPWNTLISWNYFDIFWKYAQLSPYYKALYSSWSKVNLKSPSLIKLLKYRIISLITFRSYKRYYLRKYKFYREEWELYKELHKGNIHNGDKQK